LPIISFGKVKPSDPIVARGQAIRCPNRRRIVRDRHLKVLYRKTEPARVEMRCAELDGRAAVSLRGRRPTAEYGADVVADTATAKPNGEHCADGAMRRRLDPVPHPLPFAHSRIP
jgi:hypothetical protein